MVKTRKNKSESDQTASTYKYIRKSNCADLIDELIEDMSENNKNLSILVPLCERLKHFENNLSGNGLVLVGAASGGKDSHILWLSKYLNEDKESI